MDSVTGVLFTMVGYNGYLDELIAKRRMADRCVFVVLAASINSPLLPLWRQRDIYEITIIPVVVYKYIPRSLAGWAPVLDGT